jgi:hypothetical protein
MEKAEDSLLASSEGETHSFVVRLWVEARDKTGATAEWRGWIQHVQDGHRHYFQDLAEISHIVANHLSEAHRAV